MKGIKKDVIVGKRGYVAVRYSNPDSDYPHLLVLASVVMTILANLWLLFRAMISAYSPALSEELEGSTGETADTVSFLCKCGYVASNGEGYCPVCSNSVSSYNYRISK